MGNVDQVRPVVESAMKPDLIEFLTGEAEALEKDGVDLCATRVAQKIKEIGFAANSNGNYLQYCDELLAQLANKNAGENKSGESVATFILTIKNRVLELLSESAEYREQE